MLVLLRNRRNDKQGWREYLKEKCPKLSYETATLYIRLYEKQPEILAAAKAQSVTVTDLTVRSARKLIAKPSGKGKPPAKKAPTGGVQEPAITPKQPPPTLKDLLSNQAADEVFAVLKDTWELDQLKDLSDRLLSHVAGKDQPKLRRPPFEGGTASP
jgi:hypothetical protein